MPNSNFRKDSQVKTAIAVLHWYIYELLYIYDTEHTKAFTSGSENVMDDETSLSLKRALECDRGKGFRPFW